MNAVFFGVKRAFQSTLRVTRRWMAKLRMTPARFDMMEAIAGCKGGLWQSELRTILGVTPQTISRMLKSLEELKCVVREHDPFVDWRRLWVSLTKHGRQRLARARRVFIRSGALQLALDCALVERDRIADRQASLHAMLGATEVFWQMRHGFHDEASLYEVLDGSHWSRWRPREWDGSPVDRP